MSSTAPSSPVTMSPLDKVTSVPNFGESYQILRPLYFRGRVHIYLCKHVTTNQLVVMKHTRHNTPTPTRKNLVSKSSKHQKLVIPRGGPNENTPPLVLHLSPDSIDQERLVAQLIQSRGGHRNILKYHNVSFTTNPTTTQDTYLIMEYCKHGDLFTLLEQQLTQRFDEATALHFFNQIVQGVHFLHQSIGIAHRDLSLENILVDDQGCLKICDFGLSTMANRRSNETVGKLFYMAPEIVAGHCYDPIQADIWSLGIVLFIMLTGSPLYHVADPSDRAWNGVRRIGIGGLLKQWGLDHHISSSTIALLTAMLQVNPSKRLTSLDGVLQHLMMEH